MYAAFDHNPQGEYYENGVVNWPDLVFLGAPLFVFSGGPFALAIFGYLLFSSFCTSRANSPNSPLHSDPSGR